MIELEKKRLRVLVCDSRKGVAKRVADIFSKQLKIKPSSVIGLASGKTMIPIYRELVLMSSRGKIDFSKARFFNLDEYLGVAERESFQSFIKKNFISKINVDEKRINFISPSSGKLERDCREYEARIKKIGGIDLQILGIGRNGHIAFNEPGSSFKSGTRRVRLTNSTYFDNGRASRFALTLGIKSILSSKKIVLAAFGKEKAGAIARAFLDAPSERTPASALQLHKNCVFVVDKSAASHLID